ncbi:MAG TPA: carboxypeptidase regulatory-like domain-containing protein [Solirubrobacterales bacterium]|nr:carboxypeptidase regulatory-like domain-containing protein [Solirubrobacterales bacterium]
MKARSLIPAVVAVGLCLLLTPALAAAGAIKGKVTAEGSSKPISRVVVCATPFGGSSSCASTGSRGRYAISGLAAGTYKVGFDAIAGGLNYVTEYYDNKPTFELAQKVTVKRNQTTSGIDAALAVGGQITGTVTDEATAAPLQGIRVCGFVIGTDLESCARTDGSGAYDVIGLPSGDSYKVEFSAAGSGLEYATEYYENAESALEGTSVAVTAGAVTAGINAALAP